MNFSTIKIGEIRHVTRNPDVIIKVIGPFLSEAYHNGVKKADLKLYIQTNEFPKYHYVVILNIIDSYTDPGSKFFVAKLITHSEGFDNMKITNDLYYKALTTVNLTNSFITRDKFLIPFDEVLPEKIYGIFDLAKLEESSKH